MSHLMGKLLLLLSHFVSDSVLPHRRQPTRLPRRWDSPGKYTGVGCHFFLQCMKVKSESQVSQSCPSLSDAWSAAFQVWAHPYWACGLESASQGSVLDLTLTTHTSRRRQWHSTPVLLPGKSHGRGSLVGCSPWGREKSTSLSLFTFMHWRKKWQPTPVFLPGEPLGRGSLVSCYLWGHTESDTTEAT